MSSTLLSSVEKAVVYVFSSPLWYAKVKMMHENGATGNALFDRYLNELLEIQGDDGSFPLYWMRKFPPSVRYTIEALEILEPHTSSEQVRESFSRALNYVLEKQGKYGFWSEEERALKKLRRKKPYPGWNEESDIVSLTSRALKLLHKLGLREERCFERGLAFLRSCFGTEAYEEPAHVLERYDPVATSEALDVLSSVYGTLYEDEVRVVKSFFVQSMKTMPDVLPLLITSYFKLMVKYGFASPDLVRATIEAVIELQKKDGGWSYNVRDYRSSPVATLNVLSVLSAMSDEVRENVRRLVAYQASARLELRRLLLSKESEVREYMNGLLADFGVRKGDVKASIFLAFLLAVFNQFQWTSPNYDPIEALQSFLQAFGRLRGDRIDKFTDEVAVESALARSKCSQFLSGEKIEQLKACILLFAEFLVESSASDLYSFFKSLAGFVLRNHERMPRFRGFYANLGMLLYYTARESEASLNDLVFRTLTSFPLVGKGTVELAMYYMCHFLEDWIRAPLSGFETPVDWYLLKPLLKLKLVPQPSRAIRGESITRERVRALAREVLWERPIFLYNLWMVTYKWCAARPPCIDFFGRKCWLYDICPSKVRKVG